MRPCQLMLFLGAGVAASAGLPTAWDMIWRFKRDLYVAQRKLSAQTVADLADPAVQRRLDAHIATVDRLPPAGSPEEYSALFEAAYPAERSEEHTSELQSLMRSSYAVFCLKKKTKKRETCTNIHCNYQDICI